MPQTSSPCRMRRTLTNCSSLSSNSRRFFPNRPATPRPTSTTRTSAAASTALPLASNSPEALAKLSTPTACLNRRFAGEGHPMGQLNTITDFITQLLTQHIGQFAFLGQGMFLSFSTIMIVWFGAKAALSSSGRGGGFQFGNFAGLVMMIAFGFAMTQYYAAPIPGFG